MGDVISLSKHRKAKARADRKVQAQANRAGHGRTKAERAREESEAERAKTAHELLKFESPQDEPPAPPKPGEPSA